MVYLAKTELFSIYLPFRLSIALNKYINYIRLCKWIRLKIAICVRNNMLKNVHNPSDSIIQAIQFTVH